LQNNNNFLDKTKKKYNFDEMNKEIIEEGVNVFKKFENMLCEFKDSDFRFFYYEDLFYENFHELFNYLNIKYIKDDFENILNKSNKYNIGYTINGNPVKDILPE
jgi:hypothetical protein